MLRPSIAALAAGMLMGFGSMAAADAVAEEHGAGIVDIVKTGCETELTTFCKDVTPGEERVLACLYAHNDKLSTKCENAIYSAADKLNRILAGLNNMAAQCNNDIQTHCAEVPVGGGRILGCLEGVRDKLNPGCSAAITNVAAMK